MLKKAWNDFDHANRDCKSAGSLIYGKSGIPLEECRYLADIIEKTFFIWFTEEKMPNKNTTVCHLYKECSHGNFRGYKYDWRQMRDNYIEEVYIGKGRRFDEIWHNIPKDQGSQLRRKVNVSISIRVL